MAQLASLKSWFLVPCQGYFIVNQELLKIVQDWQEMNKANDILNIESEMSTF